MSRSRPPKCGRGRTCGVCGVAPRNARRAARAPLPEQTCERCHERESRCYCSHDATPEDIEIAIAMDCCAAQDAAEARGEAYVCPHGDHG